MCGLAGANEFYMQMTLNAEWKNIVNCDQWLATATTVTSFIQRERESEIHSKLPRNYRSAVSSKEEKRACCG